MCIDFTNLNKACPNDSFPLAKISQMVDVTIRYPRMTFLDAYSRYNQISMKKEDKIHTPFITQMGLFCYRVMSFGFKNVGATYQRLMDKIFVALFCKTWKSTLIVWW